MPESVTPLIAVGVVIVLFIVLLSVLTSNYSLNGIKSKTVGDGQHGTARWALPRISPCTSGKFFPTRHDATSNGTFENVFLTSCAVAQRAVPC